MNALNEVDFAKFDVTLVVDELEGELLPDVPNAVRIVRLQEEYRRIHDFGLRRSATLSALRKHPLIVTRALIARLRGQGFSRKKVLTQLWLARRRERPVDSSLPVFDVAVAYAGGMGIWNHYILDAVHAHRKICWIHGDYRRIWSGHPYDQLILPDFDAVVAVSPSCRDILLDTTAVPPERVLVRENEVPVSEIVSRAGEAPYPASDNGLFKFVSMGRLDVGKGYDLALQAAAALRDRGAHFRWYILGEGPDRSRLERFIAKYGLSEVVRLLGAVPNPYPYLGHCDAFLHPSRGEGKSLSVEEAKSFCLPIVITAYPTVGDQVADLTTGLVVPISSEGLAEGMERIMKDEVLRGRFRENLRDHAASGRTAPAFTDVICGEA
ncbi:glycosyltransferase [Georgenia satyanarayanai]|uniref:glycosyltransferase n=1 Tax=Georgenia satyanarayanai TaxID=860221 RepID=UPI00203CB45E|nr:glycosyltransferase [Georgenia satyanarayanai]MCM3661326.1 glycosyltransferase [Georgenia satyanarayanai]